MVEDKYQPCPCGSGRKLKFCCYEKSASLNTMPDSELIRRAAEFPVCRCLVNRNWHEQGLAPVFVVRQLPNLTHLVGVYLVDVFCLGIKETFVRTRIKYEDLRELLRRFPLRFEEINYEDARSIILGAAEYARQLGFEPHHEWAESGWIVESGRPFNNKFKFGKDGKPFYVQGPEDNAKAIMKRLEPHIEKGNADYLIVDDPANFTDLIDADFDEAESFKEWCDEILDMLEDESFNDAYVEIKDMLDEFPERSEPFFLMGTCLTMEDKPEEAIPFFHRAISIDPSPEAYYNLAGAHRLALQIEDCLNCMKKVIKLDGDKGRLGRKAKAEIGELSSIIGQGSGLTWEEHLKNKEQFERAFDHLLAEEFEEAILGFKGVLKVQPGHVQSYGNLALAYAGLGDHDEATRHFLKAIDLDPAYQPAINNLRILRSLPAGERLDLRTTSQVDFYTDRAKAQRSKPLVRILR